MNIENPQGNSPYVWRPRDVDIAWAIKQRFGKDAGYVAGGTLLQLQWQAGGAQPKHLISLEGLHELTNINESVDDEGMTIDIGALCRLSACQSHPVLVQHWPLLAVACHAVGAPAVRNRATIGGNVANGHGDTLTALLALDGELAWFHGDRTWTPASVAIHGTSAKAPNVGPGSSANGLTDVSADISSDSSRLLTGIRLHRPVHQTSQETQHISLFRKLGRRAAFVPSLVSLAVSCVRKVDGSTETGQRHDVLAPLEHVRLAVGAIDFAPRRLTATEALLEGATPHPDLWQRVHSQVMAELDPPDTPLASADYRRLAAANVLVAELAEACNQPVKEAFQC